MQTEGTMVFLRHLKGSSPGVTSVSTIQVKLEKPVYNVYLFSGFAKRLISSSQQSRDLGNRHSLKFIRRESVSVLHPC